MKRIFNKTNSILFGCLLGGILVAGLGTGIAVAEYMNFEYDDSFISEQGELSVDEFTYEMADGERVVCEASSLTYDESVPIGTVLLKAEYCPQHVEVGYTTADVTYFNEDARLQGWSFATELHVYPIYAVDSLELFMQHKDTVLEGLKEGRLVRYDTADYAFNVALVANPADKQRVFLSYDALNQCFDQCEPCDEDCDELCDEYCDGACGQAACVSQLRGTRAGIQG